MRTRELKKKRTGEQENQKTGEYGNKRKNIKRTRERLSRKTFQFKNYSFILFS